MEVFSLLAFIFSLLAFVTAAKNSRDLKNIIKEQNRN